MQDGMRSRFSLPLYRLVFIHLGEHWYVNWRMGDHMEPDLEGALCASAFSPLLHALFRETEVQFRSSSSTIHPYDRTVGTG